ncbi:MAG: hypothetical protein ACRC17_03100 [Culicoidibacterales bacterium]
MIDQETHYNDSFELNQQKRILNEQLEKERKTNQAILAQLELQTLVMNELLYEKYDTTRAVYSKENLHKQLHPILINIMSEIDRFE